MSSRKSLVINKINFNLTNGWTASEEMILPSEVQFNSLTPASDQDRISPYCIGIISCKQVMRLKKKSIMGLLIDPIPNSPNQHDENRLTDSKENYWWNLGRVKQFPKRNLNTQASMGSETVPFSGFFSAISKLQLTCEDHFLTRLWLVKCPAQFWCS